MKIFFFSIAGLLSIINLSAQSVCIHENNTKKFFSKNDQYSMQYNRSVEIVEGYLVQGYNLTVQNLPLSSKSRLNNNQLNNVQANFKKYYKGNKNGGIPVLPYTKIGNSLYAELTYFYINNKGEVEYELQIIITFENVKPPDQVWIPDAPTAMAKIMNIQAFGPTELKKPDSKLLAKAIIEANNFNNKITSPEYQEFLKKNAVPTLPLK